MTDMAENMKAAMDLIYLVSCAVNEEKPDAEKCAATAILPVNATESYIRGDANGDGVVSIGDVKPFNGTLPSSNILTATV